MVVGVTMVKDESDIIESSITRMLQQVDRVIVADNGSTDGTREILAQLNVTVIDDPDPAYYQSRKMTELALRADAEWVVPFDADEVWIPEHGTVASTLKRLPAEAMACEALLYEHVPTAADPMGADPIVRMVWREAAAKPLRKVACRPRKGFAIDQGNHFVNYNGGYPLSITRGLEIRHFPYRSPMQFVRKVENGAAAYRATDLPEGIGAHWRGWGEVLDEKGPQALEEIFNSRFWFTDPEAEPALVLDPCPWS